MESKVSYLLSGLSLLSNKADNPNVARQCERLKKQLLSNPDKEEDVIIALSDLLCDREHTVVVAKFFSKVVLHLISHKIKIHKKLKLDPSITKLDEKRIHLDNCLILGQLIVFHPDILQFCLQYFSCNPSPFEYIQDFEHVSKKRKLLNHNAKIADTDIVECCYNFLTVAPDIFRQKWNWSIFVDKFIGNVDPMAKWLSCQCIAILFGMSEIQCHRLENAVIGDELKVRECMLKYETSMENRNNEPFQQEGESPSVELLSHNDHVVNVGGILLPVYDAQKETEGHLVPVKSTQDNLRSLALAIASGKATCLVGPVGCGKTALVEHLALLTGRDSTRLRKVQLGDQTDSRTLLGTYRCTDIPGEFIWQPGVLTQAVQQGQWLLLEDIDCAAIDVASVLSSLLERNVLSVPGYRDALPVAPGFQLFVTQRTLSTLSGFYKQTSNASALLQKHWAQINVEPLSRPELVTIVETLFPAIKTISSRMVDVFMLFSVGSHQSSLQNKEYEQHALVRTLQTETSDLLSMKSGRLTSTRDLIKWCTRAVIDFDISSHDSALKVLQDAIDIFVCSLPDQKSRIPLAKAIGAYLGIVETKAEYYCNIYKPTVSLEPNSLHIGRTAVARKEVPVSSINLYEKRVTFSFTRRSTCLLERIACCVNANEPVLLVGETGTGKTSSIQYLAKETGHKLVVINMNQQSDSADLLGGYKPVDLKYVIAPIRREFESLFRSYFDGVKNAKFLEYILITFNASDWKTLLVLMKQSQTAAVRRLTNTNIQENIKSGKMKDSDPKTEAEKSVLLKSWLHFGQKLIKLELQLKSQTSLAFAFIEGSLIKALKEGYWVLLDEINLASAETLECLSGLLEGRDSSISLLERGDNADIERHKDFTLFACMNPATDVGKRDLPAGLRNRFTEFYVEELTDKTDLLLLIGDYLRDMMIPPAVLESIFQFYINIRNEAKINLMDGTGQSPHYSLRTLCRALSAASSAHCGTFTRSLYETTCLSFLTQLDRASHPRVESMIAVAVLGKKNLKSILNQPIPEPKSHNNETYVPFEGYWVCQGKLPLVIPTDYVLTPSVRKNLRDLVRVISLGKLPILLQGDTSVGKTSLITYIAKASGNHCVRINNHQHTDLQEYVGSYATDSNGKLIFREGVLVEAMRKGHWIILDELNLAPSDVLEALNRVLDDNRELFIPETQQVVKADPNFMLFATQNPPGLYGGRKLLSRAFRNRFVELHFDEIPRPELETILHERCHMPPSYCKKVIAVMAELQARRKGSAAVQGKEGFITLRDLFRWGQRYKVAADTNSEIGKYYDWDQHIADEGYLVLSGRVRQLEERVIIQQVLLNHIKRKVNPENLFILSETTSKVTKDTLEKIVKTHCEDFEHVVWTFNMRRLAVLIAKSFSFNEPVLLVGETGCGKTTVCQVLAALRKCQLLSVNCHMHTEGSDFLGGLRPVRHYNDDGKLFEWVDGPLIDAMKSGQLFLADEISLADDSVLERMNSLLEPERQLLLAEKGLDTEDNSSCIVSAQEGFHFIGTMNPGGDYGKKELSPALRNRFTEIWCDHVSSRDDLLAVLEKSVYPEISLHISKTSNNSGIGDSILDFVSWFKSTKVGERFPCSIRDLLSWVHFINYTTRTNCIDITEAYVHGASLIFLDCFGTGMSGAETVESLDELKRQAIEFLIKQIAKTGSTKIENLKKLLVSKNLQLVTHKLDGKFGIDPFFITCGNNSIALNGCMQNGVSGDHEMEVDGPQEDMVNFSFTAPTTGINTMRLLRGLQLKKAILLEGSPGVGKTSLVTALAKASGHRILRINLSDQSDISDLFGADLPTAEGTFAWREGAFLTALQNGDWILLDELNLAPQPVLEGLNACLDHRGEIYIPELGRTFKAEHETRIFACQNPLRQGGSRRGLPQSFLNRFTQVFVDTLTPEDLLFITSSQYPSIPSNVLQNMIAMNSRILCETSDLLLWGHRGSPWELNLRDIQRWCDGIMYDYQNINSDSNATTLLPGKFARLLYIDRMRTSIDKNHVKTIYEDIFGAYPLSSEHPQFYITSSHVHIGDSTIVRSHNSAEKNVQSSDKDLMIVRNQLPILKSLIQCVNMNWLSILVGPTSSGKSTSVQVLANLIGKELKILPVTSAMDTTDILGGFEQADYNRHLEDISLKTENIITNTLQELLLSRVNNKAIDILQQWEVFRTMGYDEVNIQHTMEEETKLFSRRQIQLKNILNSLLTLHKDDDTLRKTIEGILSRLLHLQEMVTKDGSINSGGKFEWVDSLLVKCLLDGSWLLVDNVNLCSSAVLDRLNGLLEPNGVLSIPERGGANNEIKPHPEFRMFFTMDPKNGEISRAMRNRGVEIYIIGPEESQVAELTDTIPALDISAMISSAGLPAKHHKLFIVAHENMCSFLQNHIKPSQCHLLQTAFLTCQQILRGDDVYKAIVNSFSDVYIKSRLASDFLDVNLTISENKNKMLNSLVALVDKMKAHKTDLNELYKFLSQHTLSSAKLQRNSTLECIKQQALLLNVAIKASSLLDNLNNITKLSHLLYFFYSVSSKDDCKLRYDYVNSLLTNTEYMVSENILKWLQNINYSLYFAIINAEFDPIPEYPWDMEFIFEIKSIHSENKTDSINKLSLLLYFLANLAAQEFLTKKSNTQLTVLDYSRNVLSGSIADFSGSPLLIHCSTVIDLLDKAIVNILSHKDIKLQHKSWSELIQLFKWRSRFSLACNQSLLSHSVINSKKKAVLREDVITNIGIHYKWASKWLIQYLVKMVGEVEILTDLTDIISTIDKSFITQNSPLRPLGKHVRKYLGHPTLYPDEKTYLSCVQRHAFIDNISIITHKEQKLSKDHVTKIILGKADLYRRALRSNNGLFDYPNDNFFTQMNALAVSEKDKDIEIIDEAESSGDNFEAVMKQNVDKFVAKVQLWPVEEYFILRVTNLFKVGLFKYYLMRFKEKLSGDCDMGNNVVDSDVYDNLMTHLSMTADKTPSLPVKVYSLITDLNLLLNNPESEQQKTSLLEFSAEIWDLLTNYLDISPATNSSQWLTWKLKDIMAEESTIFEDQEERRDTVPMDFPHLTYSTVKLVLQQQSSATNFNKDNASLLPASMVGWRSRSKQLETLHHLLWRNMTVVKSKSLKYSYLDAQTLAINYERMILCLHCALSRKDDPEVHTSISDSITDIVNNCTIKIEEAYQAGNRCFTPEMLSIKNNLLQSLIESASLISQIKETDSNSTEDEELLSQENIKKTLMVGRAWTLFAYCNVTLLAEIGMMDPVKKDRLKLEYIKEDTLMLESTLDVNLIHGVVQGIIPVTKVESDAIVSWNPSSELIQKTIEVDGEQIEINKDKLYNELSGGHPHCSLLIEAKKHTLNNIKTLSKGYTFRPSEPTFSSLSKEYVHFTNSLGSPDVVLKHYKQLTQLSTKLLQEMTSSTFNSETAKIISKASDAVKECSIWQYSVKSFYAKVKKDYSVAFPDLTAAFLNAITQLSYGIGLIKNCIMKMMVKLKYGKNNTLFIESSMQDLVRFPIINKKCENFMYVVDFLTSSHLAEFLERNSNSHEGNMSTIECHRLLKVSLQELYSGCLTKGNLDVDTWDMLTSILNEAVASWQKQQQAIEKKKQEEDLLYVNKTKCDDPTEEEQLEEDLMEMFPSYSDLDFIDFKTSLMEQKKEKTNKRPPANTDPVLITFKDIVDISSVHSELVNNFTCAEWLKIPTHNKTSCNYLSPLLERYATFAGLLDNVNRGLEENLDAKILPSLLILVAHARGSIDGQNYLDKNYIQTNSKPNFYHDSWVSETQTCLPTLEIVTKRTTDLLKEYPDFPTLKDIMTVANRILDFPMTSPVARFLTGLELLRDKIEEWNKNAHKRNNMVDIALTVAQVIVTWRKLELESWRDSLNNSFERAQSEAHKWWFYIYTLVDCFVFEKPMNSESQCIEDVVAKNQDIMTAQQFIMAMQHFIEKSSLAEFNKRLEILYTFHCHAVHLQPSARRDQVMCILWNLYKYYSQFSAQVMQTIKDKRTPIEKKLRDFVKICSWERDLSYWAVKDLVDKAHKTLHKHIKEFEAILQMKANEFLSVDKTTEKGTESVGVWDRPKRVSNAPVFHYMIDPQHYLTSTRVAKKLITNFANEGDSTEAVLENSNIVLLPRMLSLLTKAKHFCKHTLLKSMYPGLVQNLDGFVTEIIDTSKYLKELEVSRSLPKPKQVSQAKAFLQQKRKALADLFRSLTRMGVSYRTGLVESAVRSSEIINFIQPPVNLHAAFAYLKHKRCDVVLLSVWDSCEMYYQRCIARMRALMTALLGPSPELGPQNIDRCKGNAAHLMIMVQEQKTRIAKYSRHLCILRNQVSQITAVCESEIPLQSQTSLHSRLNKLNEVFSTVVMTMEQFNLLLEAYPKDNLNSNDPKEIEIAFDVAISDSPMVKCFKDDPAWQNVSGKVNQIIFSANKQKTSLNNISNVLPSIYTYKKISKINNTLILCQPQVEIMEEAFVQIKNITVNISDLIRLFNVKLRGCDRNAEFNSPVVDSLLHLSQYLSCKTLEIEELLEESWTQSSSEILETKSVNFTSRVENLVSFILVLIQELYKKYHKETEGDKVEILQESEMIVEQFSNEEEDESIVENHLKKQLQEGIASDMSDLNLAKLIVKLDAVMMELNDVLESDRNGTEKYKRQMLNCIPLLEQISLLAQFFITQQVATHRVSCKMLSVLLNVFNDLLAKGFCTPSDLAEEAGEGEGAGTQAGGMGLADGEGEKDVSDRIKSQDDVEEAKKPGEEEKKEKDRDCKEEENGVQMTDDFESHLQDLEGKEGSDEDSEEEDDPDKQMGDTETGADKLDEQLWGSDNDEDVDENEKENKDKEEKGSGKPLGDKEVSAKEDNKQDDGEDGVGDDKKKEKNKKDINEMEEPEYDDDQVDPYHGKQKPLPEPEAMDLPDDMNLDDQDGKEDQKEGEDEQNPFEIDVMEDKKNPPDEQEDSKDDSDKKDDKSDQKGEVQDSADEVTDEEDNNASDKPEESEKTMDVDEEENETEDGTDKQDESDPTHEELNDENKEDSIKPPQVPGEEKTQVEMETEEAPEENEKVAEKEEAKPSQDKATAEENVESSSTEKGTKDMVQTNPQIDKDKEAAPYEQSQEQDGDEKEGVGQSELSENQKGHKGDRRDRPQSSANDKNQNKPEKRNDKRNKPGTTDQDRALGEIKEPVQKKMKTLNIQDKDKESDEQEEDGAGENNDNQREADLYQHIKQAKESDIQAIDAATKEQAENQPVPNKPEDENVDEHNPEDDIEMDNTEDIQVDEDPIEKLDSEKVGQDKKKDNKKKTPDKGDPKGEDTATGEMGVEVEGENVATLGVQRGAETSFHTMLDMARAPLSALEPSSVSGSDVRQALLSRGPEAVSSEETAAWHALWGATATASRMLTERLRLVLEPTGLSRLAGDYRTGRRINMRRVIPYIASHFRKDRIWLRRTRPAKREYQIAVAIDDSSSMSDNKSKDLAFESLALVSQALNLLEAGELSILSFGEDTQILHSFGEQFTESSGCKLLHNLTFQQTKTRIAQLMDFATAMFDEQCSTSNAPNAKLLLIVSDGRNILTEGADRVKQAVRRARQKGIFIVYLIVDSPNSKDSIMEIRYPYFQGGQLVSLSPYLDIFPFPFYVILRDIASLPSVLSDALRQWFELAANIDKQ